MFDAFYIYLYAIHVFQIYSQPNGLLEMLV